MSLRMIENIKRLRVTPTQKLVLFCLADCHNGETGRCDPSYAHIMQITGLSNRAVATALHALRDVRVLQFDSRNGWRTSYQITPQGLAAGLPAALPASASPSPSPVASVGAATAAGDAPAALVAMNVVHRSDPAICEGAAPLRERASPPPVNVLHSLDCAICEPAAASCERGSLLPVNVLHCPDVGSSEPAAQSCERGSPSPVKEVHINRKVSEGTGSTGGRPPRTDSLSEVAPSAAAATPPQNLKPRREDWRDWHRQQARRANAVSAPLLSPPEFAESWTRYRDYRTRRATEARISSEAVAWTLDAAEAALRLCERHATTHGWPAVAAQVDAAIHARWQGLHFQTTNSYPSKPHANSRPTPARSDSANAPGRYA
ncbi:helix-turn-helix domain-containing protein [Prosthecobacter sp.]|uniref:helix-turn-helix domain-containing protein n=1 Tax=Prosthecobacter sp. TaxID=1965333 RepID=UPI0024885CDD|nr:helix-turn-helix domain-containing protein [Prosthecobacter sp.]MDI1313810.1 helix-turn-helix domain-containing protein [Prosthecobacter sp.]